MSLAIFFQPIIIQNCNVQFALVLHLNCTALRQSESINLFMYIINYWILKFEAVTH